MYGLQEISREGMELYMGHLEMKDIHFPSYLGRWLDSTFLILLASFIFYKHSPYVG